MTHDFIAHTGASYIPESEINDRLNRLQVRMQEVALHAALIFEPVELLYYTGSMPSGVLFVPAEGEPDLFVRRNFERARSESPIKNIMPFTSFKEIVGILLKRSIPFSMLGIDEFATTLNYFKLLKKNFANARFADIGHDLKHLRAIKSPYEIEKIKKAAEVSRQITSMIPNLLVPGISEWELVLKLFHEAALLGGSCVTRLAFNSGECFMGTVCFGDSANKPSSFDGPDGIPGKSPVCPIGGSDRTLKKGDLVFVDMLYPYDEYYVDKTRIFSIGMPDDEAVRAHKTCLQVQRAIQERLKPGAIPSKIYDEVFDEVVKPNAFETDFMGFGTNQVKFLSHGVGMVINEYPVIAQKSDDPLEENMVLAVEPKKALAGLGMVGIENTFQITAEGGLNLTEDTDEIVIV